MNKTIIICLILLIALSILCLSSSCLTYKGDSDNEVVKKEAADKEPAGQKGISEETGKDVPAEEDPQEITTVEEPDPRPVTIEYGIAFGIDYTDPDKYLVQGEQSMISDSRKFKKLYSDIKDLDHLGSIYNWLKDEFTAYSAGGKTIGKVTVDELLESRRLGGCHDHGLVYAAVARELGYPAVMVRTSSIVWIKQFKTSGEEAKPRIGHVFVEVYLDNKWILIDSTNGWYLDEGYSPAEPVISLKGKIAGQNEELYGFYVERKGLDTWDFGIYGRDDSAESMDGLASMLDLDKIVYPDHDFKRFSR
jgi:hypothetical protein